jgi:Protein of unknown function (DUF2905)
MNPGSDRHGFFTAGALDATNTMNRPLITLGTLLIIAGLIWPWLKKMHLFHLPGDILIDRPGFKFFFPITTMLIVSAVLSILAWLLRR